MDICTDEDGYPYNCSSSDSSSGYSVVPRQNPVDPDVSTTSNDGFLHHITSFIGDHWLQALIVLILLSVLLANVRVVGETQTLIIERLGKFNRVMHAGLRFKIPFIERVAGTKSLQQLDQDDEIKIKTNDDFLVTVPVTLVYCVVPDKVREAYYTIENPDSVLMSLVLNEVKALIAGMHLNDVFTSRNQLASRVKEALAGEFGDYGYEIINVVVDDPQLSDDLQASFNNASGMAVTAKAQADYRNIIADGHAAAMRKMGDGTALTDAELLHHLQVMDTNDAIRDAAGNEGATVVVATPHPGDGLYSVLPGKTLK